MHKNFTKASEYDFLDPENVDIDTDQFLANQNCTSNNKHSI